MLAIYQPFLPNKYQNEIILFFTFKVKTTFCNVQLELNLQYMLRNNADITSVYVCVFKQSHTIKYIFLTNTIDFWHVGLCDNISLILDNTSVFVIKLTIQVKRRACTVEFMTPPQGTPRYQAANISSICPGTELDPNVNYCTLLQFVILVRVITCPQV